MIILSEFRENFSISVAAKEMKRINTNRIEPYRKAAHKAGIIYRELGTQLSDGIMNNE